MAVTRPPLATASDDTFWRALFDHVPFYVGTVSPTGVVLSINRAASVLAEQIVGRAVTEIAPSADPSFRTALAAVIGGADAATAEFAYPQASGTRWISCHLVPLRSGGEVSSVLVVGFDATEAKQSGAELRMSVNALHRLLEEREALAADLHDGILQSLYGVGLRLEAARGVAGKGDGAANPHLNRAIAQLNETMADIRRSITVSRASMAATSRWEDALTGVLRGLEVEGGPTLVVELAPAAARRVSEDDRGEIVFIAREAVSNAMRHARAERITVRLTIQGANVRLEVEDDGQGFHHDTQPAGLGLLTMTRRAGRMGATLTIQTHPGAGTLVRLELANPSGGG
ncbi:MAG: ATP-binding protein [Gemmatimonadales bacterium]